MSSLQRGDFYATIGVVLKDVRINKKEYVVEILPYGDAKYTTFFIGNGGKILYEEYGLKAVYNIKGNEGYVRAKVVSSTGDFAITQPVLINK